MMQIELIPALEYALRNIASKESQVVAFDIWTGFYTTGNDNV